MPNSDIFDRKEGYGHTEGTVAAGKDNLTDGTVAEWQSDSLTVPAAASEALGSRLGRTRTARQTVSPDLDGAGAWDGTNTTSGSNTALADADAVANHDVNVAYRDIDAMDSTERSNIGFADRTDGWGHTAGSIADLKDS